MPCVRPSSDLAPALGSRSLFPDLEARAYLAYAAISPPSILVREAVTRIVSDYAARGVVSLPTWAAQRQGLKRLVGDLLGAEGEDIALTSGTTRGICDLAFSLPWGEGDRILLFEGEFPANVTPWQQAARAFGVDVRFLPLPEPEREADLDAFILGRLEDALREGVRLVAVSAVQFQTGLRMPLAAMARLCHDHDAEFAVDAIQACGVVPVDVKESVIDYLVCGAHKWMLGMEGAGFLYVRPGLSERLVPRLAGWLSHEDGEKFLFEGKNRLRYDRPFKASVDVFEGSTCNAVGLAALEASAALLLELGIPAIFEHVTRYLDELELGLSARGFRTLRARDPRYRSGILAVDAPPGSDNLKLAGALRQAGVIVSVPDGFLRFAPHFPNAVSEVEEVLAAIDSALP